jgi:hypothetical protein
MDLVFMGVVAFLGCRYGERSMARVHRRACAALVAILACTPERRPRKDTGDPPEDDCGVDASDCPDPFYDPSAVENSVIEFEDDPNNASLEDCDKDNVVSPGADIDAAELNAGNFLTSCQLTNGSACENDSAAAAQAEGPPDATGKEETGTYTSLNGGLLRCSWSNGAAVTSSDNITVIEISESSGEYIDQFRIRVCDALSGDCQRNSPYASGDVSFPGADLF